MNRKSLFVLALILTLVGPAAVQASAGGMSYEVLARYGWFRATEGAFRDIYGQGAPMGLELRAGKGRIFGWLEASTLSRKGTFTLTDDETKVRLTQIEAGALFRLLTGRIAPYVGAGFGYYMFKETNFLGKASRNKTGFCGVAGVTATVVKSLILDFRAKYSRCKMKPADFSLEIGGLTLEAGAGLRF